jgi:hypothetical protein
MRKKKEERAIMQESSEENNVFRGVSARAELNEALEAVTLKSCVESVASCCMVCFDEFSDCLEVADQLIRMPCQHVCHKDCIVRWLKDSHLCRLCRFPMPHSTS